MSFKVSDLELPEPISYHPTMDVNDSSKIQAFQDCPRGFFFRYVLGWQREASNVHLVFGSAWHEAMEQLYQEGLTQENAVKAVDKFMQVYREGFPIEEEDDARAPKDPATAIKGISSFVQEYSRYDAGNETLFTEVAAAVPIREDGRLIHGKVDAIVREDDGIWSHEHKTTGRNSSSWRNKWGLIIQVGTYSHVLHSIFIDEPVQGVKINGAVFTKSRGAEFLRIPVRKTAEDMQQYLWEVNHWIDILEWNWKELERCSASDDVMTAFPKNAQSCSKFGCRYDGLCSSWNNPLKRCHVPPPGFEVEFWDPRRENEKDANFTTEIEDPKTGKLKVKEHHKTEEELLEEKPKKEELLSDDFFDNMTGSKL